MKNDKSRTSIRTLGLGKHLWIKDILLNILCVSVSSKVLKNTSEKRASKCRGVFRI